MTPGNTSNEPILGIIADRRLLLSILSVSFRGLTALFVVIAISRVLGVSGFSDFTYSLVAGTLLALIVDYGLELKLTRDAALAQHQLSELTVRTTLVKMLLALLAIGFFLALLAFDVLDQGRYPLLVAMLMAQILYSFSRHLLVPFRIRSKYGTEVFLTIASESTVLVSCVTGALFFETAMAAAAGFLLGRMFGVIIIGAAFWRTFGIHYAEMNLLDLLRAGFPFAVHSSVAVLYLNIDILIIERFVPNFDLGIYQAGVRAVMAACLLTLITQNVFLPRLAEAIRSPTIFEDLKRKYLTITISTGALVSAISVIFREPLIRLIFGEMFLPLAPLVPFFAIVIVLRYIGSVYGMFLTILPKGQGVRAAAAIFALMVIIVGNIALVPEYGTRGALFVLVAGHVAITAIYVIYWHAIGHRQIILQYTRLGVD